MTANAVDGRGTFVSHENRSRKTSMTDKGDAMNGCSLLYVTAGSRNEAVDIGRTMVEERLAACANVIGPMTSIYRWQGAINQDDETVLVLKTATALVEAATTRILSLHSYTCPCVIALPIDGGNPDFLAWIAAETN